MRTEGLNWQVWRCGTSVRTSLLFAESADPCYLLMAQDPELENRMDEGEDDDDSDSDDSSSSDEDQEIEVDPADMELLVKLEADLEANPNLYDSHVKVRPHQGADHDKAPAP